MTETVKDKVGNVVDEAAHRLYEKADEAVNSGAARADHLKIKAAEALEEAARKLRSADASAKSEDVKHILHDVETRVSRFKSDLSAEVEKIEAEYHEKVKPVETVIAEHPIPAVLIGIGLGVLIGALIFKSRD